MAVYRHIDEVPRGGYDLIMADPAWTFETWSEKGQEKSPQAHYTCETLEEIKALPMAEIAAPNALLFLWATNPMLPQAFEALEAWGFSFVTAGSWVKLTKWNRVSFGNGHWLRSGCEPFLVCVREDQPGDPAAEKFLLASRGSPRLIARDISTVILGEAREHSRKPEEAYEVTARLWPGARRLDMFAREHRPDWGDAFGNEVGKFGGASDGRI